MLIGRERQRERGERERGIERERERGGEKKEIGKEGERRREIVREERKIER